MRNIKILDKINAMEVTEFRYTCWFYNELTEAINEFLNDELEKHPTVGTLVELTLARFKRAWENTNSEKSIVYVTLMERILEEYGEKVDITAIVDFVQFIKTFIIEYTYYEQLNTNEMQLLLTRVNKLREKLNLVVK